ncbi:MAG: SdiA-regulated domain-containing protein [Rhodothermaceae bacterium]
MKIGYNLLLTLFILLQTCTKDNPTLERPVRLAIISSVEVDVAEPSDLALSYEGDALWTVSDDNSTIYKLSLDGKVLEKIETDYDDLEGVTVLDADVLAIAAEEERKICIVNLDGELLKEIKLHLDGEYNKGLEGLVFNPDNNHFYAVNEKYPAMLIELDKEFNVITEKDIDFVSDLSAVTYDKKNKQLLLLSDESKIVAVCDLKGNLLKKYKFSIQQAEGICLKDDIIYIISDPEETLYKLEI